MGEKNRYKIVGNVVIADEKKNMVNKYVLDILYKCGIRKTGERILGTTLLPIIEMPTPDENGVIYFNYSIYEKRTREFSAYNTKNCELISVDRGYNEFGLVMNLIMFLLEAFSEEACYVLEDDKLFSINGYKYLLTDVLGEMVNFPRRDKPWDMLLFFRERGYTEFTAQMIWENLIDDDGDLDLLQVGGLTCALGIKHEFRHVWDGTRACILTCKTGEYANIAYELLHNFLQTETRENLRIFLQELLPSSYSKRAELAEQKNVYGNLACLSLRALPAHFIYSYAKIIGEEFWNVYDNLSMGKRVYSDVEVNEDDMIRRMVWSKLPFFKAIRRKNMDECLGLQEYDEKYISTEMKDILARWKEEYSSISVLDEYDLPAELEKVLKELVQSFETRYIPADFIDNCLLHKNNVKYQKLVLLLKNMLGKGKILFPELSYEQQTMLMRKSALYDETIIMIYFQIVADDTICKKILGV